MTQANQLIPAALPEGQARVVVTYGGRTGDLADPVSVNASHDDVRRMVQEALRTGGIRGLDAVPGADISGFVVDPAEPTDVTPFPRLLVRPKVTFGR